MWLDNEDMLSHLYVNYPIFLICNCEVRTAINFTTAQKKPARRDT